LGPFLSYKENEVLWIQIVSIHFAFFVTNEESNKLELSVLTALSCLV
jgi:hypothetical protein